MRDFFFLIVGWAREVPRRALVFGAKAHERGGQGRTVSGVSHSARLRAAVGKRSESLLGPKLAFRIPEKSSERWLCVSKPAS